MRKVSFVTAIVTFILLVSIGMTKLPTIAQESTHQPYPSTDWITFTHPEFGFGFSYPANWQLENYLSLAEPSRYCPGYQHEIWNI